MNRPHLSSILLNGSRSDRIRAFRAHLAETNAPRSVAGTVGALYHAARLMMAERDWSWLRAAKKRLDRDVPSCRPSGRVITSLQLLEVGEELMEESKPNQAVRSAREMLSGFATGYWSRYPVVFRFGEKTSLSLKSAANLSGKVIAGSS